MISLYAYITHMQYIDLEQHAFHYQARLAQELDHDRQVEQARQAQRDARDRAAARALRTARSTAPAWYQRLLGAVLNPTAAASRAANHARNAVASH
jgi:hypothetical protein